MQHDFYWKTIAVKWLNTLPRIRPATYNLRIPQRATFEEVITLKADDVPVNLNGYTVTTLTNAPDVPTESEIADAVRTELTTELSRLSNAATVQNVADIVEGAFSLPET